MSEKTCSSPTSEHFEVYLRQLQENPYSWPNDYFAWQKPDGSLFIVGIHSTQMNHILCHELAKYSMPHMADNDQDYVSYLYSISPTVIHLRSFEKGGGQYDPVEDLVKKISGFEYLGSWHDTDILMDSKTSYNRVLACGRWDLAMEHIQENRQHLSLDKRISEAIRCNDKSSGRIEPMQEPQR